MVEVEVREAWNGTQLRRIEREYGGVVADCIKQARVPGKPFVKVEEVK